jgi:hypothetical protein
VSGLCQVCDVVAGCSLPPPAALVLPKPASYPLTLLGPIFVKPGRHPAVPPLVLYSRDIVVRHFAHCQPSPSRSPLQIPHHCKPEMSQEPPDWFTTADYAVAEPGDGSTSHGDTVAGLPPGQRLPPWTWDSPRSSPAPDELSNSRFAVGASESDFLPSRQVPGSSDRLRSSREHDAPLHNFTTAAASSLWSDASTPEATSSRSNRGVIGGVGNGVILPMLGTSSDLPREVGAGDWLAPTSGDVLIRQGMIDSGLASSANDSRKHSRPSSSMDISDTARDGPRSGSGPEKTPKQASKPSDGSRSVNSSGRSDEGGRSCSGASGEQTGKVIKRSNQSCKKCRCVLACFSLFSRYKWPPPIRQGTACAV